MSAEKSYSQYGNIFRHVVIKLYFVSV